MSSRSFSVRLRLASTRDTGLMLGRNAEHDAEAGDAAGGGAAAAAVVSVDDGAAVGERIFPGAGVAEGGIWVRDGTVDSCSCTNMRCSPRRIAKVSGACPDKKSFT